MTVTRALAGFVLASAIAIGGRRARSLSTGGAIAAVAVGTVGTVAGWNWAAVLILFFVTSSALSRFRRVAREARIASIVEKGDERDAWQVLANGGVFGLAALGLVSAPAAAVDWGALAFGALAAATSDTWATEIGTLAGRPPRSIVSLKALPPGTSGGDHDARTRRFGRRRALHRADRYATGASNDPARSSPAESPGRSPIHSWERLCRSGAGATVALSRPSAEFHSCGQRTRIVGGVPGARNDVVNVICTIVGGVVAVLVAR
jgi:uncharacterized membrane protein